MVHTLLPSGNSGTSQGSVHHIQDPTSPHMT